MSDFTQARPEPSSPGQASNAGQPPPSRHAVPNNTIPPERTQSGWVGWIVFGGVMLVLSGVFNVIDGFVALFNDTQFVTGSEGTLVIDLTAWGWVHIILGGLLILAGVGLFTGATWARITAVILASLNAIAQMTFLPAFPAWSLMVIALDVLVIWAVVVHGREMAEQL